jgi:cell division transport system permease protein
MPVVAETPAGVRPTRRRARSRGVGYFLAEGLQAFRRNGLMSAAAVTITTVTLLSLGATLVLADVLDYITHHLERQVQVVAYLRGRPTPAQVAALRARLLRLPGVRRVDYVSEEEALRRLQESLGGRVDIRDLLSRNPLPASVVITAIRPAALDPIARAVRRWPEVEEVSYGVHAVDRLLALTRGVRVTGEVVAGLLAVVALIVIASTIRLTVLARRAEIEVMRLVGATAWFIRWPFVVEGAVTGACGAAVAVGVTSGAYAVLAGGLGSWLPFVPFPPADQVALDVSWKLLAWGVGIGVLGSVLAVRRSVRV